MDLEQSATNAKVGGSIPSRGAKIMYEYLHISFLGSYWVECEILGRSDTYYHIGFIDMVTQKYTERMVSKDFVKEILT